MIRNEGGLASDDAIRSLAISHSLLGTREAVVIAHTTAGCSRSRTRSSKSGSRRRVATWTSCPSRMSRRVYAEACDPPIATPANIFEATGFVYDVGSGRLQEVA